MTASDMKSLNRRMDGAVSVLAAPVRVAHDRVGGERAPLAGGEDERVIGIRVNRPVRQRA